MALCNINGRQRTEIVDHELRAFPRVSDMNVSPPWDNRTEMISLCSHWPTVDVNYWDIKMSLLSIIQEMSPCPLGATPLMPIERSSTSKDSEQFRNCQR